MVEKFRGEPGDIESSPPLIKLQKFFLNTIKDRYALPQHTSTYIISIVIVNYAPYTIVIPLPPKCYYL